MHFCTDAFIFLWSLTGGKANRVLECLQISWCSWCECFWFPPSSDRWVISTSQCCRVGVGPLSRWGDSPVWFYREEPGELENPGRKPQGGLWCLLPIYRCLYSCRQRTVKLWQQRRDGCLLIPSFACLWQKRKAFLFPYLQSVWYPNESFVCTSAFTFEPMKQCGWPETSQPLRFQSKDVGGLNVLYRCSSLTTPPLTLMCTDNQSWEEGWSECVCGGQLSFFLPPSLPSACGSSRGESATFQEEEVQLSVVLAFISFPSRFTAALWHAPSQKNLEETLPSQACTGAALCTTDLVFEKREWNTTQTMIYVSMCKVRVKVANVAAGSSVLGGEKFRPRCIFQPSCWMICQLG